MNLINDIIKLEPYSLNQINKNNFFFEKIKLLTKFHFNYSNDYKRILKKLNFNLKNLNRLEKVPFLPIRLFKSFDLISIQKKKISNIMLSSGTSGAKLSKIYLDRENAINQSRVLQNIINTVIGKKKIPMLVIDKKKIYDVNNFNASMAAIKGFSLLSTEITYLLNNNNEIDYEILNSFLKKNSKNKFLIFGFTGNIYLNFYKKLDLKKLKNKNFYNSILIHGGGWKKLENIKVNNKIFKEQLSRMLNIGKIINYYGLIEQTGSIFFECKCGYFATTIFSDVLIRDENLTTLPANKKGIVQLLSLLPTSYPGHSILTEDLGQIIEDKNCTCFNNSKKFIIHGRIKEAEVRGCANI